MKSEGKSFDSAFLFGLVFLFLLGILVLFGFGAGTDDVFFSEIFARQGIFGLIGGAVLIALMFVDYRYYRSFSTPIFFISVLLLIAVLIAGQVMRGTVGWIQFMGVQVQPVEFVKVALVIFLASFISQKRAYLHEKARLIASSVFVLILTGLVLLQPDFGSAMLLLGTWGGMILLSGIRKRYVVSLFVVGLLIASVGWFFLAPYQKDRIVAVLNPQADALGYGYNVAQSLVAIGSSGWFGKGVGYGSQSQLNFLPEKHTDFIFASLVETLGFVGGVVFLLGMMFFLYRVMVIARRAGDDFGYLMGVGFFVMFSLQAGINIGMNMGIFPVTGIPLPFLSYGGSSLIASCIACGILLNISRREHSRQNRSLTNTADDDILIGSYEIDKSYKK